MFGLAIFGQTPFGGMSNLGIAVTIQKELVYTVKASVSVQKSLNYQVKSAKLLTLALQYKMTISYSDKYSAQGTDYRNKYPG
jgi:hypothetical protein